MVRITKMKILVRFTAWFLKNVVRYRKSVVIKNINHSFPNEGLRFKADLSGKYYQVLVRYLFETLTGIFVSEANLIKKIKYKPESPDMTRGKIILGNHFGNWEMTSIVLPILLGHCVMASYKPLSNRLAEKLMKKSRSKFGLKLYPMGEIVRHMARNGTDCHYLFINDQSPPRGAAKGQFFNFLHQDTYFYESAEKLAKKYQMEVVYLKTKVTETGYEISFEEIDAHSVMEDYVKKLERDIREAPEYWLWSHNRWKHVKSS